MNWHKILANARGRRFWRSLDELLDTPDFRAALASEFPALASGTIDWERRDLLRGMGAALALAGLTGCQMRADEASMPYVDLPEGEVPGRMRGYATAVTFAGYAQPLIGMTNAGRPTKLEGNPDHPMSRGKTDAFAQAALLDLYDPDRGDGPRHLDRPTSWSAIDAALAEVAKGADANSGHGLALLTGAISSPTMLRQITALRARWPKMRWHSDEIDLRGNRYAATTLAFGRPLDRLAQLDAAETVVAFDDDPLGPGPEMVANSLGWAQRRRAFQQGRARAALLVAEPSPTLTGGRADARLIAEPGRIPLLVTALAASFGLCPPVAVTPTERRWIERAAKNLAASKGKGLVLVGGAPEARALAFRIDAALGNLAATSRFVDPVRAIAPQGGIDVLTDAMLAGTVSALLVIDADPVQLPGRASFADALRHVPVTIHAGVRRDATARGAVWHVPLAHDLESWSDARALDGTPTIIQPLVRPFRDVRGRHAVLATLLGEAERDDRKLVRETWQALGDDDWAKALVSGIAGPPADPVSPGNPHAALPPAAQSDALALLIRPDPTVWDGRFANNPWAQESPKPFTTLTWDNAVLVAPALAREKGLANGDMVRLSRGAGSIVGPVWIMAGQAPRTVLIHLGYGRRDGGTVSDNAGFDASTPIGSGPLTIVATGEHRELAVTQHHHAIDGTDLIHVTSDDDRAPAHPEAPQPSFYPPLERNRPSWGMTIDLDLCTGCGACVTACVAENNIPSVGREQVAKGRHMHWLRVDGYQEGEPDAPAFHVQPIPCMHCEDAPCEMGCPVNATVHSPEGLNVQVYNRCIGTRTCSSYCPYKVRRFNWYDFTGDQPESVQAQRNPSVSVRPRGVMEKCSYCIQRLSAARIDAKLAGTAIADGAAKTACQQVCPTGAISFGDIADPAAEVTERKQSPRHYSLLPEANTRPRTTYLARIRRDDT